MKVTGLACGLMWCAFLLNAPAGAAPDPKPPPAPQPVDAPAPRKERPDPPPEKPAATDAIPSIEPHRPGDKLDLGLCDGS